jgi:CHAT domain-containing protein
LFIRSQAHGSLVMEGRRFAGEAAFNAGHLSFIGEEIKQLKKARKAAQLAEPVVLTLSNRSAVVDDVLEKLAKGPWDIVHFAGHSVCADNGDVFLLLPGSRGPVPMRVQDFAQAAKKGEVRLIILSSCESSSPDGIFRLAQAGVPAAIGFRWEVDDKEAAEFTAALHRALADDEPIGRAFHIAVQRLKAKHIDSPTFASPVLMVQDETWAVPKARVSRGIRNVVVANTLGQSSAGASEGGWSASAAPAGKNGSQGTSGI